MEQSFAANVKNHNVYALCSLLLVCQQYRPVIFLPKFFAAPLGAPRSSGPQFIEPPEPPVSTPLDRRLSWPVCGRYKQRDGRERWQTLRAVGGVDPITSTTVFALVPDTAYQFTSTTVFALVPDTAYQFMVLARNRLGDGLFSNVVDATTTGATISGI